jgi:hypothetical protein
VSAGAGKSYEKKKKKKASFYSSRLSVTFFMLGSHLFYSAVIKSSGEPQFPLYNHIDTDTF